LQKNDPTEELQNSEARNFQLGDDNFDHRILEGMKLKIPCTTWDHDDARSFFGIHYKDKTTTAYVRKVHKPNTKTVKFDLEFPEIPPAVYKTWVFDLEYVLKYACGLH
jgi:hypothetical protein